MNYCEIFCIYLLISTVKSSTLSTTRSDNDDLWGALLNGDLFKNNFNELWRRLIEFNDNVNDNTNNNSDNDNQIDNSDENNNEIFITTTSDDIEDFVESTTETTIDDYQESSTFDSDQQEDTLIDDSTTDNITSNFYKIFNITTTPNIVSSQNIITGSTTENLPIEVSDDQKRSVESSNDNEEDSNKIKQKREQLSSSIVQTKDIKQYIKTLPGQLNNGTGNNKKKFKNLRPKVGQTSLVLVFDGTGSMHDDLTQLRDGAKLIVDKFSNRDDNPIFNYIFVPFRDPDNGPALVTIDQSELFDVLNNLELSGGGDCPESTLNGLSIALQKSLPKSFVYVFTDAIAKDYLMDKEIISLIQKKQTTITFLLTGFCKSKDSPGYEVYERIAAASNGQVFNLQKFDIKDVIEDIKNHLDKRRVSLKYFDSYKADKHSIDVEVDKNLKEFSVSVAGHKPNITVIDPQKQTYDRGKEVLNLENLKIVNVEDPAPGQWNIKAESDSAHSIRLTGLSDVIFHFGFSLQTPENISQTSFTPLLGSKNVLAISPTNSSLLNNLTTVDISLYNDKIGDIGKPIKFSLDLMKIDKNGQPELYVTKPFEPPRQMFKIDVNGFDINGNPLKRLLSTVIQSTEENPPEVNVELYNIEIDESSSLTLKCHVQSLIPVKIQWLLDNQILNEIEANQTTELEYIIENADPASTGEYICRGENRKGYTDGTTNVKVNPQPLLVFIEQREYQVTENQSNFQLMCIVSTKRKFVLTWYFNGTPVSDIINSGYESRDTILLINKIKRDHAGLYICTVRTRNEEKSDSTKVTVLYPPEISAPLYSEMHINYNKNLNLSCIGNGIPEPQIIWTFQSRSLNSSEISLDFKENLTIQHFMPQFEGIYKCQLRNGIGSPAMKQINVIGKANGPPIIQKLVDSIITVTVGDYVRVACKCVLCKPIKYINWTLVDPPVSSSDSSLNDENDISEEYNPLNSDNVKIIQGNNTIDNIAELFLEITNITTDQANYYKCQIGNDFGTDTLIIEINVRVPPEIQKITIVNSTNLIDYEDIDDDIDDGMDDEDNLLPSEAIIEGSSTAIKCEVKGFPIPIVQWSKDGLPIIYDRRIFPNNETLFIMDTLSQDAGLYQCQAINPLGEITRNFTLIVLVPPKLLSVLDPIQASVEGASVHLPCQVYAVPPPQITWFLNGHEIEIIGNQKYIESTNTSLKFNANAMDSGIYECRAVNTGGNISQELVLIVYVEPTIYPSDDEIVTVRSNRDALLICDATGFPLPGVSWTYRGKSLENSTNIEVYDNGHILLKNISSSNEGAYICEAFNGIGFSQKVFYMIVKDPPIIVTDFPNNFTLLQNESIEINCEAHGNPVPHINWLKDDQLLESDMFEDGGNLLQIYDADSRTDQGNYTCYAENSEGIQFKRIEIIVIDAPQLNIDKDSIKIENKISPGDNITLRCPYENFENIKWIKILELALNYKVEYFSEFKWFIEFTSCLVLLKHIPPPVRSTIQHLFLKILELECKSYESDPVKIHMVAKLLYNTINDMENIIFLIRLMCNSNRFMFYVSVTLVWALIRQMVNLESTMFRMYEDTNLISNASEEPISIIENKLQLKMVNLNDSGNYTCIVENKAGQGNFTYLVEVLSAPTILILQNNRTNGNQSATNNSLITIDTKIDDHINIQCNVIGNPEPKVEWWRHENQLISNNKSLNIQKVTIGDMGLYLCKAKNELGSTVQFYEINVMFPLTYSTDIKDPEQYLEVNEGEPLHLNCSIIANPSPIYNWTKNGKSINILNQTIVIQNATSITNGIYKCLASNEFGSKDLTFHVNVFSKPMIKSMNKNITLLNTNKLTINCKAIGNPRPILTWLLNGQSIGTTSRIHFDHKLFGNRTKILIDKYGNGFNINENKLFQHGNTTDDDTDINRDFYAIANSNVNEIDLELVYSKMTRKFSGNYTCVATNAIGKDEKSTFVTVLEKPTFKNVPVQPIDNIEILEGLPLILNCPAIGKPIPDLYWFRDSVELKDINNDIQLLNSGQQLFVKQISINKNGNYSCLAKNIAGDNMLHFNVTVLVPPKINDNLQTPDNNDGDLKLYFEEGSDVKLNCPIEGYPIPNITWMKIDYRLKYKETILKSSALSLNISNITDSSTYLCYGNNSVGEANYLFHIVVLKPPQLEDINDKFVTVKQYHGITLDCPVIDDSEPNITWYKGDTNIFKDGQSNNNYYLSSGEQFLRIKTIDKEDAGKYKCHVENELGSVERNFIITVNSPVHWSPWSPWNSCSTTCGPGTRFRQRKCLLLNGRLASGTADDEKCIGERTQIQECQIAPCPINGGWGPWSQWSLCTKDCIEKNSILTKSIQYRRRTCDSPMPDLGGKPCNGLDYQEKLCNVPICPINGGWSEWEPWSKCSASCNAGTSVRFRKCNNPVPEYGGLDCIGDNVDAINCLIKECPVNGGWSEWSNWSVCSKTCGKGVKNRKRECNNPKPAFNGALCHGPNSEIETCYIEDCRGNDLRYNSRRTYGNNFDAEYEDDNNSNYSYQESRPIEHIMPPPGKLMSKSYAPSSQLKPAKVIVKVINEFPITRDITQMSFNLDNGIGPMTVMRPSCEPGYTFDYQRMSCTDIDECVVGHNCHPDTEVCTNKIGGYTCNCASGYMVVKNGNQCLDINECTQGRHKCTHVCENLPGTYRCNCPFGYKLLDDSFTCLNAMEMYRSTRTTTNAISPGTIISSNNLSNTIGNDVMNSETFVKYAEMVCPDGFEIEDEKCFDIDECATMEHECGIEQSCLNTKGSYVCVPTPCPDNYERDVFSGQCIQLCNLQANSICTNNATVAQTISYTVLSIKNVNYEIPILKLVNYDVNRIALENTNFSFHDNKKPEEFLLNLVPNKNGIVYLYARQTKIELQKVYKIDIIGRSFSDTDVHQHKLLYLTKFVVYIYVL